MVLNHDVTTHLFVAIFFLPSKPYLQAFGTCILAVVNSFDILDVSPIFHSENVCQTTQKRLRTTPLRYNIIYERPFIKH